MTIIWHLRTLSNLLGEHHLVLEIWYLFLSICSIATLLMHYFKTVSHFIWKTCVELCKNLLVLTSPVVFLLCCWPYKLPCRFLINLLYLRKNCYCSNALSKLFSKFFTNKSYFTSKFPELWGVLFHVTSVNSSWLLLSYQTGKKGGFSFFFFWYFCWV